MDWAGVMLTTRRHGKWIVPCALLCAAAGLARGDDTGNAKGGGPGGYQTTVTADRDAEVSSLDASAAAARKRTGFVTVIDASHAAEEVTDLAEVLAASVGVHVRSLGGLGAFSSVSVRGAAPGQIAIYLDGVPLSRDVATGVDLGDIALETIDHVEIYRGAVPLEMGGALGGALNLVTKAPTRARTLASASLGSFGARRVVAAQRARSGGLDWSATAVYAGARGDFTYFDDAGTPYNLGDDAWRAREGNAYDQGEGALRLRWGERRTRAQLGARALVKAQGLPPTSSLPGAGAALDTTRVIYDARVERSGALALSAAAFGLAAREHYVDGDNTVGVGVQDRRYTSLGGGVSGQLGWSTRRQRLTVAQELRTEWFSEEDLAAGGTRGGAQRWAAVLAAREEVTLGRAVLEASLRSDLMLTEPHEGSLPRPAFLRDERPSVRDAWLSPRAGAKVRLGGELYAKANFGRYVRAPSFIELFGDRGATVGNPDLRAETGLAGDVGLVLAPRPRKGKGVVVDRLLCEAALFESRPHDTIVLLPVTRVALAQNLGDARIRGLELSAAARLWRRLTLSSNYTYVDAENRGPPAGDAGKRLPGRPAHELYARAELVLRRGGRSLGLRYDVAALAGDYLDAANFNPVPARVLHGAQLALRPGRGFELTFDAKNLSDERVATVRPNPAPSPDLTSIPVAVADVMGQPLPGRALFVTLAWSTP